jgi:hypothetical protein
MFAARRWRAARAEHDDVVRASLEVLGRIPAARWHEAPRPAGWSPAAVTLHLCQSYELSRAVVGGAPGMALRVPRWRAWLLRTFLVPPLLASRRFPRGARAPREVRPDAAEASALGVEEGTRRLARAAADAASALEQAATTGSRVRFTHAYFGALPPLTTLRVLSAHTRHHTRALSGVV